MLSDFENVSHGRYSGLEIHQSSKGVRDSRNLCATGNSLAKLVQFLLAENLGDEKPCPSTILVDERNRCCVDHIPMISEYKIDWRICRRKFEKYDAIWRGIYVIDEYNRPGGASGYPAHRDVTAQIGAKNVDSSL